MEELSKRISLTDNVLMLVDEGGDVVKVALTESALDNLRWLSVSDTGSVFTQEGSEWSLFFGPYIVANTTGYVFQALNKYTRKVFEVRVPFTESVNMSSVRTFINSLVG